MSRVGRNIHVSVDRLRQLAHRDARPRKIKSDAGTCPKCDSHYSADEMSRNLRVCPACGHHFPVTARERLEQLGEPGGYVELWPELRAADPLQFTDLKPYAERIARALKTILDTRLWIEFDAVPDERTGAGSVDEDGRVSLGEVATEDASIEINLVRSNDEWFFAPETVAAVPAVARSIGSWWTTALPAFFTDVRLAEIELWQWIGLCGIAIVGVLAGMFVSRALRSGADIGALRGLGIVAPTIGALATPAGFLLSFIAMRLAEGLLALSIPARANLSLGLRAATVFVIAWAVVRWIRAMSLLLEKKLEARGISPLEAGAVLEQAFGK